LKDKNDLEFWCGFCLLKQTMKANWIIFVSLFPLVVLGDIKHNVTTGSNPAEDVPGGGQDIFPRPLAAEEPSTKSKEGDQEVQKKVKAFQDYKDAKTDGVLDLNEFIDSKAGLSEALKEFIAGPKEPDPKSIKVKFKELTGQEPSEEELAKLLVAASFDQTNDKNDAFIAQIIESAWKKDPSQRTPIEKAMLERGKKLMKGEEDFYRELAEQSGISDVRAAFRFQKLSQLENSSKSGEAAKVAADWLINMGPEARKKLSLIDASEMGVAPENKGFQLLKKGAVFSSETLPLMRSSVKVSPDFKNAWEKNGMKP
jgi:hypothetical protein